MWAINYWEMAADLAGLLLIAIMIWTTGWERGGP
jgi:hypothetical protein